jgi:hypothetical protein
VRRFRSSSTPTQLSEVSLQFPDSFDLLDISVYSPVAARETSPAPFTGLPAKAVLGPSLMTGFRVEMPLPSPVNAADGISSLPQVNLP